MQAVETSLFWATLYRSLSYVLSVENVLLDRRKDRQTDGHFAQRDICE